MAAAEAPVSAFEAFTYHGGALAVAARLRPSAPLPWIDLSTGINPHAYPLPALPDQAWTRLPEAAALARLEAVAAARYGAPPEATIAAAGSQALIQALARLLPARRVGVLGLTYSGHAQAWRTAGAPVETLASPGALATCGVAVVVNPNNPDGRVTPRAALLDVAEAVARRSGVLVVDEAFADFDGEQSLAPDLPANGVVVLRSFGKTYGLAGLRLGFALASPDLAPRLRAALGPWPVSGPAIRIGAAALADGGWLEATRARRGEEAARLDALLTARGWSVVGGTRLFRLARRNDAPRAFERLLAHGILARPFAETPDRLRFGIPGEEAHWRRLEAALSG